MAKYNLYRIWPEKRFELIEKLRNDGLEMAKKVETEGVTTEFFFSREPEGSDIWWTKTYKDYLDGVEIPKNIVYSAAFFVYSDSFCYAVALGKTYMQIKNYCDQDFGFNLAERIASERVKVKNSKFFKSRRNRITTNYQESHRIEFESGESLDFIRAATVDPGLWGSDANFGTSVQFSLEITPDQLPIFVKRIEETLGQDSKMNLPKVAKISDPVKQKDLDAMLADLLQKTPEKVNFISNDNCQYGFYLQGAYGDLSEKGELTNEALQNFITLQNVNFIDQINDIKVRVFDPEGRERTKNLKAMFDFMDQESRICLIDGKWYRYNQSFVNFLRQVADATPAEKEGQAVAAQNLDEFIEAQAKNGFTDCRKAIIGIDQKFKVGRLDLYKDGTLYFVRFGSPEAVNYTVDQAINAIKYLQSNRNRIRIGEDETEVERICLWLAANEDKKPQKISQVDSLNFLMKFADWKRSVLAAGFRPRVRIGGR